jgi:hypothetical protein
MELCCKGHARCVFSRVAPCVTGARNSWALIEGATVSGDSSTGACDKDWLAVSGGYYHSLGLKRDGTLEGALNVRTREARSFVEDEVDLNGTGAAGASKSLYGAPVALPYTWRYPKLNGAEPNGFGKHAEKPAKAQN